MRRTPRESRPQTMLEARNRISIGRAVASGDVLSPKGFRADAASSVDCTTAAARSLIGPAWFMPHVSEFEAVFGISVLTPNAAEAPRVASLSMVLSSMHRSADCRGIETLRPVSCEGLRSTRSQRRRRRIHAVRVGLRASFELMHNTMRVCTAPFVPSPSVK